MTAYHLHVYFTLAQEAIATQVRGNITQAIPELTYVGRLIPMPIGPHPLPMFELHLPDHALAQAVSLIDILRQGLTVLIHPVQADELEAHTDKARWLGEPLPLDLSVLSHHH